jgi:hypothetical protein
VRLGNAALEILVGAVVGLYAKMIRDIVAVIAWLFGHRHQPKTI